MADIRKIIESAIHSKEVLLVTYERKEGGVSEREFSYKVYESIKYLYGAEVAESHHQEIKNALYGKN